MPKIEIDEIIDKLKTEKHSRILEITREAVNQETRTVELSFSSEALVERWYGMELLDHTPKCVKLNRLNKSAPLLINHNRDDQIGVVEKAWLDGKKGKALVRFSKSEKAEEIYQDVLDNIRRNVSVDYLVHKMVFDSEVNEVKTYRVTDWEPTEVSIVSIPADISVGVGRAIEEKNKRKEHAIMPDEIKIVEKEVPRELTDAERVEAEKRFLKDTANSAKEIFSMGEQFNQRELAIEFVKEGKSVNEFRMKVLEGLGKAREINTNPEIGLNEREIKQFSFIRAINALVKGDMALAPFEKEVSDAAAKHLGKEARGLIVPMDVLAARRDLTVGTSGAQGGGYNMVGTGLQPESFIELLRNKTMVKKLGAKVLDGLVGDVAIPKQTGGATAYWVTEGNAPTESALTTGQVTLSPKTVGAFTDISRKLLKQGTPSAEQLVRDDLAAILAIATDLAALHGTGSDGQPTGVAATSGIGSVVGGDNGLAPAWSHIIGLETQVAIDNADFGSLAYLTNAKVRAKLKQIFTNATYGERPIWMNAKEGAGEVNGYMAHVSNQVSSALTKGSSNGTCSAIFFGNWADLIIAEWGGLDLTADPYSLSTQGAVRIVALQDMDIAVRHAESFAAMLDALTA